MFFQKHGEQTVCRHRFDSGWQNACRADLFWSPLPQQVPPAKSSAAYLGKPLFRRAGRSFFSYRQRGIAVVKAQNPRRTSVKFHMRAYKFLIAVGVGLLATDGAVFDALAANPEVGELNVQQGTAEKPITLRDRLVVGLKARLKTEVDFCNAVAVQVQLGHLPQRLVDETFFWARDRAAPPRNGLQYRPIIFFQPAMKLRAKKIGVEL
jgi:hypothetical protein